jgi:hypothetical protein
VVTAHPLAAELSDGLPLGIFNGHYSRKGEFRLSGLPARRYDVEVAPLTATRPSGSAASRPARTWSSSSRVSAARLQVEVTSSDLAETILPGRTLRPRGAAPQVSLPAEPCSASPRLAPGIIQLCRRWQARRAQDHELQPSEMHENPTTLEPTRGCTGSGPARDAEKRHLPHRDRAGTPRPGRTPGAPSSGRARRSRAA